MNDGSAEKPYFMSDSLKNILHLENRSQPDGTEESAQKQASGLDTRWLFILKQSPLTRLLIAPLLNETKNTVKF